MLVVSRRDCARSGSNASVPNGSDPHIEYLRKYNNDLERAASELLAAQDQDSGGPPGLEIVQDENVRPRSFRIVRCGHTSNVFLTALRNP